MSESDDDHGRIAETGWAPRDLTDGREPLDWETRYPKKALLWMKIEAAYLLVLLFLVPFCG